MFQGIFLLLSPHLKTLTNLGTLVSYQDNLTIKNRKDMTFVKKVLNSLIPEEQHILEAQDMADAIYEKSPKLHREMVDAINRRLAKNYEAGQKQFIHCTRPEAVQDIR